HSDLAADVEDLVVSPSLLQKLKLTPAQLPDRADLDVCYTPIIQSGGEFNLKPSAQSNDELLYEHVITVSLGGRYKTYCSNVGRTYIINPTNAQQKEYTALLAARSALIAALVPGAIAADAAAAAFDAVSRGPHGSPELATKLGKTLGFATGLEFRDSAFVLSAKNTRPLRAGMTLALTLGLEGLVSPKAKDAKARTYALYLSDTVLVRAEGGARGAEVLTAGAALGWADVSFEIEDEADGGASAAPGRNGKENVPGKGGSKAAKVELTQSRTRNKAQSAAHAAVDDKLREHQAELEETVTRDALRRLAAAEGRSTGAAAPSTAGAIPTAYTSADQLPRDARHTQTFVDVRAEAVLVPLFGSIVPFHISTIKNVTKSEEGAYTYLRINFAPPGHGLGTAKDAGPLADALRMRDSIKELTLRAREPRNLSNAFRLIKELRTRVMRRDKEEDEKKDLVAQEPLRLLAGARVHKLRDVNMRPHPSGRKSQGTLELQANGLRYTSNKGERVDMLFANLRNCFFQPAHKEHLVLLHFHLKDGIMVGKKRHNDIQFYVEVVEQSYALDQARRGGYDPDELEEEQRERALRNRMNAEFKAFAQKIEDQAGEIEFDIPYRELGFHGLVNKTTSLIMPTVNALVELVEPPWLVVQISAIEIVHFERVIFGLKNFDMVIVFKDLKRDPIQIGTINMQQLDQVKTWLDSCNIKFYEGVANLHWPAIMKTVRDDPRGFYEGDSWRFLDLEQRNSEDEESSEEDEESSFQPTGDDDDEGDDDDDDDDDDDSDAGSTSDSDDSDDDASVDSGESSGKDWDELEKEAVKHDRKRALDDDKPGKKKAKRDDDESASADDDDSDDRPKKKKGGAPAQKAQARPAPPKGAPKGAGGPGKGAPPRPGSGKAQAPPSKKAKY
ncbi:hypothetical protein KFE25_004406, partial [Diacronema lutheri]